MELDARYMTLDTGYWILDADSCQLATANWQLLLKRYPHKNLYRLALPGLAVIIIIKVG